MPFYDGIGMISEKHAVVLDVGSWTTKVGYAGEAVPRAIVRTPKALQQHLDTPTAAGDKGKEAGEALSDALVKFVHKLYFEHLLVNPKDRRVVLVEGLLGDLRLRDAIVKVLFCHFEVLSVLLAPSHLMPLFGLGLQHGLVLDVGYKEATLIPVYQGVPILKAWQALPLASETLHTTIRRELMTRGMAKTGSCPEFRKVSEFGLEADGSGGLDIEAKITEDIVEDIKVRLCFVTQIERGQQIQQIRKDASCVSGLSSFLKKSVPAATYTLDGDTVLQVDGETRESVCEALFELDNDRTSVATMVLDALLSCPIDTRRHLAANMVIVGGTSILLGFKSRLFQEINHLLQTQSPYKEKLQTLLTDDASGSGFKLHVTPAAKPNFACWSGASLFGATDAIASRSFTREAYFKDKAIPDWSNLKYNTVYNNISNSSDVRYG